MRTKNEILAGMTDKNGNVLRRTTHETLLIEVLCDIRDELQKMNGARTVQVVNSDGESAPLIVENV